MDITESGNQITIALNLNPISWVTDNAYWQEYQLHRRSSVRWLDIDFTGTVSSSSFSADEQGGQLTQEHLAELYLRYYNSYAYWNLRNNDPNGIVVTLTSSTTSADSGSNIKSANNKSTNV